MKALALSLLFTTALVLLPKAAPGQSEPASKEHPGVVALSKDSGGVWAYKSFPQLTTLYTSQNDVRGKPSCDERCSSIWPPLTAAQQEAGKKVGSWTVINRPDGRPQWAYKGQPVYMRFHDMPADPHAMEVEGFRPLKP
jgi:predicted lipoprotein with Yx(FWY)xxD motif